MAHADARSGVPQPDASIVIPAYNAAALVAEAIDSALAQTWPRVEVIVIDDGSTDGTVEVLRRYGDRIRWETGPNRGACAARNRGVELARGEFVQFLDADDLLHPAKLERQLAAYPQDPRAISICWGQCDPPDAYIDPRMARAKTVDDGVEYVFTSHLQTSAPLHRRALLLAVGGFDPALPCAQERDLHVRLACSGVAFVQLQEKLFTWRRQAGSLSSDPLKVVLQHPLIVQRARQLLEQRGQLVARRCWAMARFLAHGVRPLARAGRFEAARNAYRLARELHAEGALAPWSGWGSRAVRLLGPVWSTRLGDWLRPRG